MFYYRLSLGVDANGKRIQPMKRGFHTEREAKKALREAQLLADQGMYVQPSKMTYGEYVQEWIEIRKSQWGNQTEQNHRSNVKYHIIPLLGKIRITEMTVFHIEKFLEDLRKKGLAEGTIKKIYNLVNSSLNSAVTKKLIPTNVAQLAENKPRIKRKKVDVWTDEEAKRFLDYVKDSGSRYYTIFFLALMTGMRQGEILGLRWKDIDFKRKQIVVNQSLSHDGKMFKKPKTETSIRSIAISDAVVQVLKQQRKLVLKEKMHFRHAYADLDLVNCTQLGKPISPSDLNKAWVRLRDKANVSKIKFHDLRHTHASLMLKSNVHPKVVSERLGHSSIQITLDLYSHLAENLQEEAAEKLETLMMK